jgi:hypothetical protein
MAESRLEFVRELIADPRRIGDTQVVGGLIQCLDLIEACALLDREFRHPYTVRVGILRRITRDPDSASTAMKQVLLNELWLILPTLPSARRAACGSAILTIAGALGEVAEDEVLAQFAQSSNGNLRKQAYRRIRETPTAARIALVANIVRGGKDEDAATTLLRIGDKKAIADSFASIEALVADRGYWLGRLYLVLGGVGPADLRRLQALDAISWLYVCAKLKRQVDSPSIIEIFRTHLFEERSGLVVWCAGQLQAWDALAEMERLTREPPRELIERYWRSMGLAPSDLLTPPSRPVY